MIKRIKFCILSNFVVREMGSFYITYIIIIPRLRYDLFEYNIFICVFLSFGLGIEWFGKGRRDTVYAYLWPITGYSGEMV